MASNTKNVKLGVCQLFFAGVDLGYTKGGVEVTVSTETHEVNIDQFGKTAINQLIMGRDCKVKAPLAETTLENMVAIMPGATLTATGGAVATGTLTVATNPTANDTVVVNGVTFTFKSAPASGYEVAIGANAAESAANLAAALTASKDAKIAVATYSVAGAIVTVKYGSALIYGTDGMKGVEGNSFTIATGTAGAKVTVSGATLTGGTEPTAKIVDVTTGVGMDLLSIAKELRLHPINKADSDLSEDFIIPLAATAGALSYAYKVDDERVFSTEFTGYPDPVTKRLFLVGGR